MSNTYISPTGNPEVWNEKPEGYFDTYEELYVVHPELMPEPEPFEDLKTAKHEDVNVLRDEKEQDYFIYDNSKFDADPTSAQRLSMASQTASTALMAGQPFEITWTLYDNTNRVMTAQNMIEVIPAFALWSAAVHNYAGVLKTQIDATITVEELEAIDIYSGWPTPEQVAGLI